MSSAYLAGGYPEIVVSPTSDFWKLSNEDKLAQLDQLRTRANEIIQSGERDSEPSTGHRKKSISQGLRMKVFKRDGYKCVTCGSDDDLQADHIIAESRGGETTMENLQTLCKPCNCRKGAR